MACRVSTPRHKDTSKCYTLLELDQNSARRQTVRSSAVGVTAFKPYKVNKKLVLCFHLGNSLASEFYMPTFRNNVPSSQAVGYEG